MTKPTTIISIVIAFFLTFIGIAYAQTLIPGHSSIVTGSLAVMITGCGCDSSGNSAIFPPETALGQVCTGTDQPHLGKFQGGNCESNRVGAATMVTNGIATLIRNQPASGQVYVADLVNRLNPAQPAYAQGLGFGALNPILPIWKAMRNVSYFLFVLVFVVVGFAIMFRAKLNPQTVVNIEAALPRLVITLILITFSYAIAGFMIDLMFLAIFFVLAVFGQFFPRPFLEEIALQNTIVSNLLGRIWPGDVAGSAASSIAELIKNQTNIPLIGDVLGESGGVLAYLIFAFAILTQTLRVFFALLGAYIMLLLSIIFAPIQLLLNAYPGSNVFSSWIRGLIAHLAIFPAVIVILIIAFAITNKGTSPGANVGFSQSSPGLSVPQVSGSINDVAGLIALGMIMALPNIVDLVKGAFGIQDRGGGLSAFGVFGSGGIPTPGSAIGAGLRVATHVPAIRQVNQLRQDMGVPGPIGIAGKAFNLAKRPFTTSKSDEAKAVDVATKNRKHMYDQ